MEQSHSFADRPINSSKAPMPLIGEAIQPAAHDPT
jgi:hypothetical protein